MATFRKVGDYQWEAMVRRKGYSQISKTFAYKDDAISWARKQETEMKSGTWIDPRLEVPLDLNSTYLRTLIEKYIEEESPKKLGSKQEIVRLKKWLSTGLADRTLPNCTSDDFNAYIKKRRSAISARGGRVAEQTIKLEIIAISNVFKTARKDWVGFKGLTNPTNSEDISKIKGSGTREVRIEPKNWEKIAAELRKCRNTQYVTIAEFAIETGMRQDELFRMTWADINWLDLTVIVDGKDTSTPGQRKKRTVPLSDRAIELLQAIPLSINGTDPVFQVVRKTSADGLSRAFTAACKAIGLEGGCFHCTRHEAASRMAPHYHMLTLMKIFGWKTPAMAARYYHPSNEELRAGIDRMQLAQQSA